MLQLSQRENPKARKTDRILVLEPIEGDKVKSTTGNVDHRLFKGGNRVHAIQDPATCFWSIKYDQGNTPEVLNKSYTRFDYLMKAARDYYGRRGLNIKEVQD